MKIKVLKDTKAAANKEGTQVKTYLAGETYEIFDELAKVFIVENWGIEPIEAAPEEPIEEVIEEKAIEAAPENKAFKKKGK